MILRQCVLCRMTIVDTKAKWLKAVFDEVNARDPHLLGKAIDAVNAAREVME